MYLLHRPRRLPLPHRQNSRKFLSNVGAGYGPLLRVDARSKGRNALAHQQTSGMAGPHDQLVTRNVGGHFNWQPDTNGTLDGD